MTLRFGNKEISEYEVKETNQERLLHNMKEKFDNEAAESIANISQENKQLKDLIETLQKPIQNDKEIKALKKHIELLESANKSFIIQLKEVKTQLINKTAKDDTRTKLVEDQVKYSCERCFIKFSCKNTLNKHKSEMHKAILKF